MKYYFYGHASTPTWYSLTTAVLREFLAKNRDETNKYKGPFPATFIFMGVSTEAPDKDTAENNYRHDIDLVACKEPACMLTARREYFEQYRQNLLL